MKYKVYKLVKEDEVVYVGITIQKYLSSRKAKGYKHIPFYKECSIELIEETEDISREDYWITYYRSIGFNLLNIKRGLKILTKNELRLEQLGYNKKWRDANKEYIKNYANIYKIENEEKLKEYKKEYNKKYKEKNREKIRLYNKEYRERKKLENTTL